MRNKIKQLLKKEGGFTLVELLAVLAILAIIVGISIPMIGNVVSSSQTKADEAQQELYIDAAQLYFVDNPTKEKVTVGELITGDYLEDNKDTVTTVTTVEITKVKAMGKDRPE